MYLYLLSSFFYACQYTIYIKVTDIALYISNYCVYLIEDTQNIHFSRNQETLTETAILGMNKTLHTDK